MNWKDITGANVVPLGGGVTCECGHYFKLWYAESFPPSMQAEFLELNEIDDVVVIDPEGTSLVACPGCGEVFPAPPTADEFTKW